MKRCLLESSYQGLGRTQVGQRARDHGARDARHVNHGLDCCHDGHAHGCLRRTQTNGLARRAPVGLEHMKSILERNALARRIQCAHASLLNSSSKTQSCLCSSTRPFRIMICLRCSVLGICTWLSVLHDSLARFHVTHALGPAVLDAFQRTVERVHVELKVLLVHGTAHLIVVVVVRVILKWTVRLD